MKTLAAYIAAAAAIAAWLLVKAPTPEFFLVGADGGHQLLGAMQILTADEHPFVDFFETYGPLTFYASALGQLAGGMRPLGEIVLDLAGFWAGLLALFHLARRVGRGLATALPLLALALLLLPQFYKYYCVLLPMMVLAAAWGYAGRPGRGRLAALALSVSVAFLYRHDFGVFALASATTLVWLVHGGEPLGRRLRRGLCLALLAAAFMGPWIVFLCTRGAVARYFTMIVDASFSMSRGLALPHPLLHWRHPWLTAAYAVFFALPPACFLWYRRTAGELSSRERAFVPALCVLAAASLAQSSHRADYYHLLEGIPPGIVCLACLLRGVRKGVARRLAALAVLGAVAAVAAQASPATFLPGHALLDIGRKLRYFSYSRRAYIEHLRREDPGFWPAALVREVEAAARPGGRVAIYPFHMKYAYFAGRPFAGPLMLLAPGYFDAPEYQRRAAAALLAQRPAYIFWNERFAFDRLPERNPAAVFRLFRQAVLPAYQRRGELFGFTVYAVR